MYGSWAGAIVGILVVLGLLLAAVLTAWTPIFAFLIFGVIAAGLLVVAAMRRAAEASPGTSVHAGDPESHAAPAAGEGAAPSTVGDHAEPDAAQEPPPERQTAGVWGEK
jgi:hypothetical protein